MEILTQDKEILTVSLVWKVLAICSANTLKLNRNCVMIEKYSVLEIPDLTF